MKLSPYHIKETINLIVANAIWQYKVSLAEYKDENNLFYRDSSHCSSNLESHKKQGHDRLQGLQYLLLDDRQSIELINTARNKITEEHGFFNALLITGKHFKDQVLSDLKEVA